MIDTIGTSVPYLHDSAATTISSQICTSSSVLPKIRIHSATSKSKQLSVRPSGLLEPIKPQICRDGMEGRTCNCAARAGPQTLSASLMRLTGVPNLQCLRLGEPRETVASMAKSWIYGEEAKWRPRHCQRADEPDSRYRDVHFMCVF